MNLRVIDFRSGPPCHSERLIAMAATFPARMRAMESLSKEPACSALGVATAHTCKTLLNYLPPEVPR